MTFVTSAAKKDTGHLRELVESPFVNIDVVTGTKRLRLQFYTVAHTRDSLKTMAPQLFSWFDWFDGWLPGYVKYFR